MGKELIIRLLQAFNLSMTALPFLYKSVLTEDRDKYRPFYQPWLDDPEFTATWENSKNVSTSRIQTFYFLSAFSKSVRQVDGVFCECGVYKGGTADLLGRIAKSQGKTLHLFDTFAGMPEQTPKFDYFKLGSFSDTSLEGVQSHLRHHDNIEFHPGKLPDTLNELGDARISFAHVDVDQYVSTKECLGRISQRLSPGGIVIVDDYGRPGTPGARFAVEEVCREVGWEPVALPTGQCVIVSAG